MLADNRFDIIDGDVADQLKSAMDGSLKVLSSYLPETCEDCFYYVVDPRSKVDGNCHRCHPSVILRPPSGPYDPGGIATVYPRVHGNYVGCGEGVRGRRGEVGDEAGS